MWNHKPFDAFIAARDPARTAEDKKWLAEVFNRCADHPHLAAPLAWAQQHDVHLFFDRFAQKADVNAYYAPGHGVIGLATKIKNNTNAAQAATIIHETRHGWQDYYRLLQSHDQGFGEYFMTFAAVEADAYSFECQVHERAIKDPVRAAAQRFAFFQEWYDNVDLIDFYSDYALKTYRNPVAYDDMEFTAPDIDRRSSRNLTAAQLYKMGEDFSGNNMFDHVDAKRFLEKISNPKLALTFYEVAREKPTPEVIALCQHHCDKTYKKLFGM